MYSKSSLIVVMSLMLGCNLSMAQEPAHVAEPSPLDSLDGFTQTYYYSPGHEKRAKSIAVFMENAGKYFEREIGFTPDVVMYILAPTHWKAYAAPPLRDVYGFPHNIDETHLAIATDDNDFWRSFLPPVDQLPPGLAGDVKKAYGKRGGTYSLMPFFDLLALHEFGHSYTAQAGLKMHTHWMSELFVNIMLHTYVAEEQPELLPALEVFPNMVLADESVSYEYTSLEDFELLYPTLGMGPRNYGWYQCGLHAAARDIYNAGGKEVLNDLWKVLLTHQEDLTHEEFVRMLMEEAHESVAEVYLGWGEE